MLFQALHKATSFFLYCLLPSVFSLTSNLIVLVDYDALTLIILYKENMCNNVPLNNDGVQKQNRNIRYYSLILDIFLPLF